MAGRPKKNSAIPPTLRINGKTWKIKLVKGLWEKMGAVGYCTRYNTTIKIDSDQSVTEQGVTLFHELMHAIFPDYVVGERTEEKIVEDLDGKLYDLFKLKKQAAGKRRPRRSKVKKTTR